ncbi:hypothetical protein HMPREF9129_1401 [Peptoniphilus indolicus ATCC 29427]|uniref:Uncharacterized protein n=1 Tax=Peptoniphilus indolicus ATCC 29427 TaxID=997350 RepID=G4D4S1_9FIRM|nr:hypothetical protein HMPREF9129_1401 [Peptoniphilus indolicus ATCC 29427]
MVSVLGFTTSIYAREFMVNESGIINNTESSKTDLSEDSINFS